MVAATQGRACRYEVICEARRCRLSDTRTSKSDMLSYAEGSVTEDDIHDLARYVDWPFAIFVCALTVLMMAEIGCNAPSAELGYRDTCGSQLWPPLGRVCLCLGRTPYRIRLVHQVFLKCWCPWAFRKDKRGVGKRRRIATLDRTLTSEMW